MASLLYGMNNFILGGWGLGVGAGGTMEKIGGSGEWLSVEGVLLVALPC